MQDIEPVIRFQGGEVCRDESSSYGTLKKGDVWVRGGKIIDPLALFFDEKKAPDVTIDCSNLIIAPGFIDIQINGAFGVDFSSLKEEEASKSINRVGHGLLEHGVTAYCPTIVTSSKDYYHRILPLIQRQEGSREGAAILGIHCEGPFINIRKKGAHQGSYVKDKVSPDLICNCYGPGLSNVRTITLAPELAGSYETIRWLAEEKKLVALGHSLSSLKEGEDAVGHGASLITHLFNAMSPFHHRDPGLVGLLTTLRLEPKKQIFYSIIADGSHTDETVLRIAFLSNPSSIVLITDAIAAMGQGDGVHQLGTLTVEVQGKVAKLPGQDILAGSVATMIDCVKELKRATDCKVGEALLAASHHPAQVLDLLGKKGTITQKGADADMVLLDKDLNVQATVISGEIVWTKKGSDFNKRIKLA